MITILHTNLLGRRVRVTRPAGVLPSGHRRHALDYVGEVVLIAHNGYLGVADESDGELRWACLDEAYDGSIVRLLRDPATTPA
jgi:hypothetical protein